jgi:UTP--glucose-1-phosphate uridylyltransferase
MTSTSIKAVIPAAGLGTRFLPATKAMPKEMLPVVDKPAIQYVVEEAVAAGIDDILMIIGRNKNALANHFDRVTELEHTLEAKGDHGKLARVVEPSSLADIHFVRQGDPKGSATPCCAPRSTSVTRPSPSCSATTSSTPATRCSPA